MLTGQRQSPLDFIRRWSVSDPKQSPAILWGERVVLCALVVYFSLHTMPRAWKSLITDFPNYYIAAQLAHESVDTSRMYEWEWLEREKDHRPIPIRVIALVPITPFSTLFVWPLSGLKALTAKRVWIILSLALLAPIAWMMRSMTGLSYVRIGLIFALNFPLYRNIEFGQFYVFLLAMIVAACWTTMRGQNAPSGSLVAIAAAAKVFPLLFVVFFIRRRNWRALAAGAITLAACIAVSIAAFEWNVHRTYLREILPAALHGEAMPPYVPNASISGILHLLFLSEPQWNPAPWHASVAAYSILQPLISMLALAPAILLIRRGDNRPSRIFLEWSALLTASLAVSTIPASYNFVLMAFPMCVLTAILLEKRQHLGLAALVVAYIGICFPMPSPVHPGGLSILLYTPRLPLMIAVLFAIYMLSWDRQPAEEHRRDWTTYAWIAAMMIAVLMNIHSTRTREAAMRQEYAYRIPVEPQGYLNADPQQADGETRFISFTLDGYHLVEYPQLAGRDDSASSNNDDELSYALNAGRLLVERANASGSEIVDTAEPEHFVIKNACDPMISADGSSIAFIRDDHGRGQLLFRQDFFAGAQEDRALTPPSLNVYEASFLSAGSYAFAASTRGGLPQVYLTDATHSNVLLGMGESRYPALSPDGAWLAYSRFEDGVWNLWIRDQKTGATRRIGNVPCNQIQPSWMEDSKTLLYGTDCGRSLWFTAIARHKVIP